MHFITPLALLATFHGVSATLLDVPRSAPGLNVTLTKVGNTQIKAVVENAGSENVTFVHLNFFKDSAPVKKVSLFRGDSEVEFHGIKYRVKSQNLTESALTSLAPGATIEDVIDIASTSDLSEGGPITIRASGQVPIVTGDRITGSVPFSSNELTIEVNGTEAATVSKAVKTLDRRTKLSSCSGSEGSALQTALKNTVSLANAAAKAALDGDKRFVTFFKTDSSSVRSDVAARLQAVAKEAGSTSSGSTTYHCTDVYGYCETNVLAYTLPSSNTIANCAIYYSILPALAKTCYDQDQATTTLHEFTHAPGVYRPGTDDLGYGYNAATALNSADALNNADSYALFANCASPYLA
ncbi:hypothetical protein AOCH_005489 [Aspergillus ochraceoroseus]|uniref:Neutral protease 2 n=1 Tax=Aspergillus ochraceoroseus TaxID=138278 RepID=A0A0F8WRZ9_9EURO|nr:hypothetical protein AOCH_005489 [Aspergillus ochraceoroseus]